ncbi:hypothetical protein BT63DRAFT_102389 [Microthyrium microscopicum]|uniref:cysteine--tRNA ligase n=1 Tax=Microthyrium microscopicum TaxID=703497 RepID=A0A6A6TYC3_9PEZI|nr:hypothetical protein BT63DRAFT_102389 [Microthyrium microscopicum]
MILCGYKWSPARLIPVTKRLQCGQYLRNTPNRDLDFLPNRNTHFTMASKTARQQPPWAPPKAPAAGIQIPALKVYNSLTRRKDDFVPLDPQGDVVTWYTCGPTVYDDAHLGHARNYVSTDILRRIMKDYFGFQVKFVMNITDVDDKIILRGRQQYLLEKYKMEHDRIDDSLVADTNHAFTQYIQKNLPLLPSDTTPENLEAEVIHYYKRVLDGKALESDTESPADKEAKIRMHINTARTAAGGLLASSNGLQPAQEEFYIKAEDVLLPYLDSLHGSTIDSKDHTVFTKLTQKFEKRFLDDMHNLNVLDADVVTRVTEFGPQIVKFIERIIANDFAYATSDGSVYFDIEAFEKAGNPYARLEPWNRNDTSLVADGEGSLSNKAAAKRNQSDFALWKASKPGEPSWDSPWGNGRPGWHIECSVMASEVLGKTIDIHSGGVDLRFPHHDNELAQSEAYWSSEGSKEQWSNYFIHMGHLSIQGMKMSKSLKNFTTIKQALQSGEWNSRSLRICLLMSPWQDGVEITDALLMTTAGWEDKLNNFFLKAIDTTRNPSPASAKNTDVDKQLLGKLEKAKSDIDEALRDSFNTAGAMRIISELVTDFNSTKGVADETTLSIARFITRIVTIFGLDEKGDLKDTNRVGWSGVDIPAPAVPFVYPVAQLRDHVRQAARSGVLDYASIAQLTENVSVPSSAHSNDSKAYEDVLVQFRADVKKLADEKAAAKDLLALCDKLRDSHLWKLKIYLEDRDTQPAMVRPLNKALEDALAKKDSAAKDKLAAKARREAEEAEKKKLLEEKAKLSHLTMFKTDEYKEWDADGIPTKDAKGQEVAKNKRKKLLKEWEKQKKLHEEWIARQQA